MDDKKIDDAIDVMQQFRSDHKNCCNELKRKVEDVKQKYDDKVKKVESNHSFKLEALKIASAEITLELTTKSDKLAKFSKEKVLENAMLKNENENLKNENESLKKKVDSLEERTKQLEATVECLKDEAERSKEKIEKLQQKTDKFRELYEKQGSRIEALITQMSINSSMPN